MAIEVLRPNATGAYSDFISGTWPIPEPPEENWEQVDEEVPDGWGTFVFRSSPAEEAKDLYNIADSSFGAGATINFVALFAVIRWNDDLCRFGYFGLKSGEMEHWGELYQFSDYFESYPRVYYTDPNTGEPWTKAAVDALQIGVRVLPGFVEYPYEYGLHLTQIYVWVDYTAISAPTVTTQEVTDIEIE